MGRSYTSSSGSILWFSLDIRRCTEVIYATSTQKFYKSFCDPFPFLHSTIMSQSRGYWGVELWPSSWSEKYTFVLVSQRGLGIFCYCSIIESKLTTTERNWSVPRTSPWSKLGLGAGRLGKIYILGGSEQSGGSTHQFFSEGQEWQSSPRSSAF